jgi:tRNA 2-thiouridine synthesizing protein A
LISISATATATTPNPDYADLNRNGPEKANPIRAGLPYRFATDWNVDRHGHACHASAMTSVPPSLKLDLSGLKCPLPVLRTRKALRTLAPGAQIDVVCTDPMAAIDIPNMVRESGDILVEFVRQETHLLFHIRKAEHP